MENQSPHDKIKNQLRKLVQDTSAEQLIEKNALTSLVNHQKVCLEKQITEYFKKKECLCVKALEKLYAERISASLLQAEMEIREKLEEQKIRLKKSFKEEIRKHIQQATAKVDANLILKMLGTDETLQQEQQKSKETIRRALNRNLATVDPMLQLYQEIKREKGRIQKTMEQNHTETRRYFKELIDGILISVESKADQISIEMSQQAS